MLVWLRSLLAAAYTFGFRKSELLGLTSPVGKLRIAQRDRSFRVAAYEPF